MAHQVYENVVLSSKLNDILTTSVNMNDYMTIDTSLSENAGMKKKIITYTSTGNVEALGMGEGNSTSLEVQKSEVEYTAKTYQGKFAFYDEEEAIDPMVADTGLKHSSDNMINAFTAAAVAEMDKATLAVSGEWSFDIVVDAIAKMNVENEEGLFLLISPADKAEFRKVLHDDLKYVEGYVRAGYIGTICGATVIVSKAIPAGSAYLLTKEAITCFIKKDTETEYERDADKRNNTYWVRKVGIVALTNANKIVKITNA